MAHKTGSLNQMILNASMGSIWTRFCSLYPSVLSAATAGWQTKSQSWLQYVRLKTKATATPMRARMMRVRSSSKWPRKDMRSMPSSSSSSPSPPDGGGGGGGVLPPPPGRRGSVAIACTGAGSAAQIDDQYAELEFRIAHCLWMLGDYGAAREHFARARDLDTLRFRADSRINDINRSVTSSSGAELVDADHIFSRESPNGIVGSELIYEHVHMTPEGNYILARAMFLQIASKLAPETGPSLPAGNRAANVPSQDRKS